MKIPSLSPPSPPDTIKLKIREKAVGVPVRKWRYNLHYQASISTQTGKIDAQTCKSAGVGDSKNIFDVSGKGCI
jgi:hypothetical protein